MHRCLKCGAEYDAQPGWICPANVACADDAVSPCGGQAWAISPEVTPETISTEKASPPASVSDQSGKNRKDNR